MGQGGPPGVRPMGPRGVGMQPRPLMDFGEQPDGTAFFPDQVQVCMMQVSNAFIARLHAQFFCRYGTTLL